MVRKVVALLIVAGSFSVSACSTVKGVGEDVKSVAECTEAMMNAGQC